MSRCGASPASRSRPYAALPSDVPWQKEPAPELSPRGEATGVGASGSRPVRSDAGVREGASGIEVVPSSRDVSFRASRRWSAMRATSSGCRERVTSERSGVAGGGFCFVGASAVSWRLACSDGRATRLAQAHGQQFEAQVPSARRTQSRWRAVGSAYRMVSRRVLEPCCAVPAWSGREAGTRVGLCMSRRVEQVVCAATPKAGGAYVPVDPGYPQERLGNMVRTARRGDAVDQQVLRRWAPRLLRRRQWTWCEGMSGAERAVRI